MSSPASDAASRHSRWAHTERGSLMTTCGCPAARSCRKETSWHADSGVTASWARSKATGRLSMSLISAAPVIFLWNFIAQRDS